jgi:SAM-dependent methyltransferase
LHGLLAARAEGFTHALTMDSDGQHPAGLIGSFMAASMQHPRALVLGKPVFDASAPMLRVRGRKVSNFWANLETGFAGIGDSLYGFRVYPIHDLADVMARHPWMRRFDFDPEAAVRLVWRGLKPLNLHAPVKYWSASEGGVSHFQYGRDNVLLTGMHLRLFAGALWRAPLLMIKRLTGQAPFGAHHVVAPSAGPKQERQAWQGLLNAASARYRASGQFGYHFARGKLGRDPVFRYLVQQGLLLPPQQQGAPRVLDIGSGQSLLASLAHAMQQAAAPSDLKRVPWPQAWPMPSPEPWHYTGIELMPKDVARARAALQDLPRPPCLINGNMCEASFPPSDVVVILDVLHYVDVAAQDQVLAKVHAALRPGGRLLLRIGDQDSKGGFAASQWVDRIVTNIRGHRAPPTWGRPLDAWLKTLRALGFVVRAVPKSEGTPFANVLLVAERR